MPKLQNKRSKQLLAAIAVVAFGISFFFLLQHLGALRDGTQKLFRVMSPFVVGGITAYIVSPLCTQLNQWLNRLLLRMKWKPTRARSMA
ncbi:MAG: hypothetical protein IJ751_00350, partial [Oscillospiraceae bacterium]|nr:hypothetical protein [Oscillospiraceae bacterium]